MKKASAEAAAMTQSEMIKGQCSGDESRDQCDGSLSRTSRTGRLARCLGE